MRSVIMLPAVLAFASLAGCVYEYAPPAPAHYTTYSYAAPSDYYPPAPPPEGGVVVVYQGDSGWSDEGWPANGRFKDW